MNKKFSISILSAFLFFSFMINSTFSDCDSDQCPPVSSECVISCGETITSAVSGINYWNYTITSPMDVEIRVTPSDVDYAIYANWTEGECPTETSYDCMGDLWASPFPEFCQNSALSAGTYHAMVKNKSVSTGTYQLQMICNDICDECYPHNLCEIGCGETIEDVFTNSSGTGAHYFYFTLTSPTDVTITVSPSGGVDYKLNVSWTNGECPIGEYADCEKNDWPAGFPEFCENNSLPAGTYYIGLENVSGSSNGVYDLTLTCEPLGEEISDCTDLNLTGTTYYLVSNIDNSTIDKCMNITANDVTLDCQGYRIDGNGAGDYGIYVRRDTTQNTNINIKNCSVTDWNMGIYFRNASNNLLTNITAGNNNYYGVFLDYSPYNSITNSSLLNNSRFDFSMDVASDIHCNNALVNVMGTDNKPIVYYNYSVTIEDWDNNVSEIVLCNADNSVLRNMRMERVGTRNNAIRLMRTENTEMINLTLKNLKSGVYLKDSTNNQITNITSTSNFWDGVWFDLSNSNVLNDSRLEDNGLDGVYMDNSENNTIYNNFFNNSDNVYFSGGYANYWNTTKQKGDRVYSNGIYIGGNYWTNSTGNGYSDTCTDDDQDGFCDENLTLATDNIDYLPLSDEADTTPPSVTINSPQNTTYTTTSITINATVTDFSVDTVLAEVNSTENVTLVNQAGTDYYYNDTYTFADGSNTIRIYANDSQGNVNDTETVTFSIYRLIIDSIEIRPIDSPPNMVDPEVGGNKSMNVTVNVTNSTSLHMCLYRIFNSTDYYSQPTKGPYIGEIQVVNSQTQCFGNWSMEYWRNPGIWNVSVDLNLTVGVRNFTSANFNYTAWASVEPNVTFVNFTGSPDETVNSTSAYPMKIENLGNVVVNVSINGTDLTGETYEEYVIGVGNISHNESETGSFKNLTHDYELAIDFLAPRGERYLYFRAYVPLGFKAQYYNNTIELQGEEV